jgi:hypothetical protein
MPRIIIPGEDCSEWLASDVAFWITLRKKILPDIGASLNGSAFVSKHADYPQ